MMDDVGEQMPLGQADVAVRLEHRILSGELAPGRKLPSERELCHTYGVSRTAVREALRGLEERGYIRVLPSRGSFVRQASGMDLAQPLARLARRVGITLRHVVEARTALECSATDLAVWAADAAAIREIRVALDAHNKAVTIHDKVATDLQFHEAIVKAAGNPLLEIMYGSIRTFVTGMMERSQSDHIVRAAGDPLHDLILERIEQRDAEGARAAMRRHVTLAVQLYGPDLDRDIQDVLQPPGSRAGHG